MENSNENKNWLTIKQKDGTEQLIFMGDVSPYRFAFNDKITGITINSGATVIGQYAFYGCSELEEVYVESEALDFNKYAFAYCPKLKHVTFNYERKFDNFLTIHDKAFLGCGIFEMRFSDSTMMIGADKIKENEDFSKLHIQAVQKMLQGMAKSDRGAEFSISLEGEEFTKASKVIGITLLPNGKFYLTDGGCLMGVIGRNPNLEVGWVKNYIAAMFRDKKFILKDGRISSWCEDIDDAADALIDMCQTIKMMGGLAYYLEFVGTTTDISDEEVETALGELLKTHENLTKKKIENMLVNSVGKRPDGAPDLRESMKNVLMHIKIHSMTPKEFKHYRFNALGEKYGACIQDKVDIIMQKLENYAFDYEREGDAFENLCMDLIEDIAGLAPDQNRYEAAKIAQTVFEILRDKNADEKELKVLQRVRHEFELATDDDYIALRKEFFGD